MDNNTDNFKDKDSARPEDSGFDYEQFAINGQASEINEDTKEPIKSKTTDNRKKAKQSGSGSEGYDWLQCLVSALLVCVLLFAFVVRTITIVGSSMVPTFHEGDSVIISNLFYNPKPGDIVVLRKESFQKEPIIKRVIATEGQIVDIDFEKGIVYVNDKALDEPYTNEPTYAQLDFDGPITVPENHVFVMGDNRNASTDSRRSSIGCVDERYIMGRVILRILPFDKFGAVK